MAINWPTDFTLNLFDQNTPITGYEMTSLLQHNPNNLTDVAEPFYRKNSIQKICLSNPAKAV